MIRALTAALLLVGVVLPWDAALAGRGAFLPTYHPQPCSGDDCRADDPRSGATCEGFLCQFSSSKAMQTPVTAAQAAEMERARAAAAAAPEPPALPVTTPSKAKRATKRVAKSKASVAAAPPAAAPAAK